MKERYYGYFRRAQKLQNGKEFRMDSCIDTAIEKMCRKNQYAKKDLCGPEGNDMYGVQDPVSKKIFVSLEDYQKI